MEETNAPKKYLTLAVIAIALLLGIAGMLAVQNWRLRQEFAAVRLPAEAAPEAEVPAPKPTPQPEAKPPSAAARKPTPAPAATRNYTRPAPQVSPPVVMEPEPVAPIVGRVVPTDVIPAEPAPAPLPTAPAPAVPPRRTATIPSGTVLTVRLVDTLSTERNQAGDRFRASLEEPVVVEGDVVLPRGTTVEGRVVEAQPGGRVKGLAEMTLELSQVRMPNGETVVLESSSFRREGEASVGEDAAKVGVGAAIGAAIGAIGGGGKGAAVGAATGAGAGTAGVLLSRGKPLVLGPETILSFSLNTPLSLSYTPGQSPDGVYSAPPSRRPAPGDWDRDRPILRRRR